jgi:chromosome segregation ATPase
MELAVKLSEMDQLSERLRDQVATRDDLVESNMKLQKAQDALLVEKDCLEKSNETTQTQLETLEATLEESEVSKNELATEIGRLKAENLTMTEKVA